MLFFYLGMSGCREADEKMKEETIDVFTKLNSAPFSQIVFPEWLPGKINEIEVTDGIKNRTFSKIKVFRGRWNKKPVYLIYTDVRSCLLCEVYKETGEKITFDEKSVRNFDTTSTDWALVYEYPDNDDY